MAKKKDEKKQPPPLPVPLSSKAKKQEKQPPASSLAPSLSTKSLAKSATTGTKQEKQLPFIPNSPSTSSSESSSDGDEPLPPPSSRLEKSAGTSTATVQVRYPEPSDSTDGEVEEEDEVSETDNESKEEEESDDTAPLVAKPNPPPLLQASREGKEKQTSSFSSSFGSGSEDGEGDGEEVDSSSESDQPQLNPPHKHAGNIAMKSEAPIVESDSDDSSESDQDNSSPHKSSLSAADLLSSKQVDRPAQPVDTNGIITTSPSPTSDSNKKRKIANGNSEEEAGLEKKNPFKRIWSDEAVLNLLRGILEYKERHHVVPSSALQLEPVHALIKDLMSFPVTLNQMHAKVRRMKSMYRKIAIGINGSMTPPTSNTHAAAVFDLSKKIWGSGIGGSSVSEKKIKGQKLNDIKNVKVKRKQISTRYPSLHRFIEQEHTNIPSVLRFNHIPNNKSNNLEGNCEKLEIEELQIHNRKQVLLAAALKLIEDALSKSYSDVVAGNELGSVVDPGDD